MSAHDEKILGKIMTSDLMLSYIIGSSYVGSYIIVVCRNLHVNKNKQDLHADADHYDLTTNVLHVLIDDRRHGID
jgi:hypothetical protein